MALRKHLEAKAPTYIAQQTGALDWWSSLPAMSPVSFLSPLARMYLSIPASSCSSESSFSSAGFLNEGRERLTTEHLEMQLVIRDKLIELKELPAKEHKECIDKLVL
jgi:hypothetical protein